MAPAIACKLNTDTTIHQELIKLTPESLMTLDIVDGTNFISNARYFISSRMKVSAMWYQSISGIILSLVTVDHSVEKS
jgi:hypothetical protein